MLLYGILSYIVEQIPILVAAAVFLGAHVHAQLFLRDLRSVSPDKTEGADYALFLPSKTKAYFKEEEGHHNDDDEDADATSTDSGTQPPTTEEENDVTREPQSPQLPAPPRKTNTDTEPATTTTTVRQRKRL